MIGTLQHIISQITVGTFSFQYGKKGYINVLNDNLLLPAVIYDTESVFNLTPTQSGYIGESGRAVLSFMYKSELDWTPQQHYTNCILPAINAARQFISLCDASELIESVSVGDGREFINLLDANTSGVSFPFDIKLNVNKTVCVDYAPIVNCQPVILTINGVTVESILSGAVFPLNVTLDGVPSGVYNDLTSTWEVTCSDICADGYAVNSDLTYSLAVPSGTTQTLPDTPIDVYLDGVFQETVNIVTLGTSNLTINLL